MCFKSLAATSRLLHRTIDYSYDALSRLLQADYDNGTVHTYGFDVAGNLTNMNGTPRTYNAANQMTDDGTNTITFDDNGNMTSDGVNSYTWDRANRLLSHAGTSYARQTLSHFIMSPRPTGTNVLDYVHPCPAPGCYPVHTPVATCETYII